MVKLDASSGVSVKEQLALAMAENSVKLIDLFREWDEDGDGNIDKKEFRKGIAGLGYDADKKDMDALFDSIDESGDGEIDYGEIKKALQTLLTNALSSVSDSRKAQLALEIAQRKALNKAKEAAEKARLDAMKPVLPPWPELPEGEDGGEYVIEPQGKHTHTIILLHSMKGAAEMYSRLYLRFGVLAAGFKFVFPRAPMRTIVGPSGNEAEMTSWFSPTTRREDGSVETNVVNTAHLTVQTTRIHAILDGEAAYLNNDCQRIMIGGSHQGGAVAVHAAMSFRTSLAGLICLRSVPLPPEISPVAPTRVLTQQTKVFMFAGGADQLLPLEKARIGFEPLVNAGYAVEWHVEPDLSHGADCMNEQRFVAYWVGRTCLGAVQGELLRQSIVVIKKPSPRPTSPRREKPQQRAQSARAYRPDDDLYGPADPPQETGFVPAISREPSWRQTPIRGPAWDTSTSPGFACPFSSLFSSPAALEVRIDRGGPMLGRVIKRPESPPKAGLKDLLGEVRHEFVENAPRMNPMSLPGSRPGSRPLTARPAWNGDTSPRYTNANDMTSVFPSGGVLLASRRPGSPRAPSPRARPRSAVVVAPPPADDALLGQDARPSTSPGIPRGSGGLDGTSPRGEGPRTRRMKEQAFAQD